jgi:hypothetical protein
MSAFPSRSFARKIQCTVGLLHNFEAVARGEETIHRRVRPGTLDVVGDGHAQVERVSRRKECRHVRADHERPPHLRRRLRRANRVRRRRHDHDAQRAGKVIGHVIGEAFCLRSEIDHTRPVGDRRIMLSLERVEMMRKQILAGVAARRRDLLRDRIFRQDLVHRLARANAERLLLEKIGEGIRQLITRNLQDALVDRVDHRARGAARRHGPGQRAAGHGHLWRG